MLKVLGISGSPRRGGNSDMLLQSILTGAKTAGAETEAVYLSKLSFRGCIGCEKCQQDGECTGLRDDMQLLYPKITESRGIVLVCPTHNYNVTAWMKAFIDRLYCYYKFGEERPGDWSSRLAGQERKAVIVSIGEQSNHEEGVGFTLEAMRRPIEALGYEVTAELPVLGVFKKGDVSRAVLQQAEALGGQLAAQLKTTTPDLP